MRISLPIRRPRYVRYSSLGVKGKNRIRVLEICAGRRIGFSLTFWHDEAPAPRKGGAS